MGLVDVRSGALLTQVACVCAFTLILRSGAQGGLLQVFEQEGFEHLGAAVEGSQDVEQPPASLAAITAMTRPGTRDYRLG